MGKLVGLDQFEINHKEFYDDSKRQVNLLFFIYFSFIFQFIFQFIYFAIYLINLLFLVKSYFFLNSLSN